MRSVVVVLPASTCAMIPMLRVRASGTARAEVPEVPEVPEVRDWLRCTACSREPAPRGTNEMRRSAPARRGGQHHELSGLDPHSVECRYLPSPAWGCAFVRSRLLAMPCGGGGRFRSPAVVRERLVGVG